ncbi:HET-domain-containing protein [Alternaria alternata]|uniref:HET-domain-containing protein n=1 Tax=Alternaria alternata TaxID=5599 RepID=A0A177D738_ALTAL|nr:HET-domain-containing protein [Alternaria alternata]OAG15485.1 HET-domain-containing protein [Alternaria alternata]
MSLSPHPMRYLSGLRKEYAILSHTWGHSDDEVTYQDLQNDTTRNKKGYNKLIFCGNQALKDGLQYFWVDTCCINKHSSAELSEAINSMFRWYQRANRCYVYLSDSRWFTRCWRFQELLAPESVEFFSSNHQWLGNKQQLHEEIIDVTGIPARVLRRPRVISEFDAKQRMDWARNRKAKREEDYAYSLLGICNVHMPLIYGEGHKQAFKRLHKAIREREEDESDHP